MVKFWLVLAAALGCLSVALGAFGAHSLKDVLNGYGRSVWEKAVLYQMFHTVARCCGAVPVIFQKYAPSQ